MNDSKERNPDISIEFSSSVDCSLDVLYSNVDVGKYASLEKQSVLLPLEEELAKFISTDIGWAQESLPSVTKAI